MSCSITEFILIVCSRIRVHSDCVQWQIPCKCLNHRLARLLLCMLCMRGLLYIGCYYSVLLLFRAVSATDISLSLSGALSSRLISDVCFALHLMRRIFCMLDVRQATIIINLSRTVMLLPSTDRVYSDCVQWDSFCRCLSQPATQPASQPTS